jgi:hypothetical protein
LIPSFFASGGPEYPTLEGFSRHHPNW